LMGTGRPDEPRLVGESAEIRRFRDAVRVRIERAAADAGGDLRHIPPAVLLSLLCASAFSAVAVETAQAPTLGSLSSGVVLGGLISAAIDDVRTGSQDRPMVPHDLEREISWRIERVLAAQDQRAAVLRTEIAEVLAQTDALPSALASAIQTGNDRLRNDVLSAIATLSGGFPELAFLSQRWVSGCPYRGLLPFDQEHAGVFFGRRQLTAELIAKVAGRLAGPSMVVVSGASGAGKSSLLHAGLLPALIAGIQLAGSDGWPRIVMTPTSDPLTELATRLAALSRGDAAAVRNRLATDPDRAHLVIGEAVADGAARGNGFHPPAAVRRERLLLVIDQFEEVFTLAPGRDVGQQAFVAALCAAASRPFGRSGEPPAVVVIAVRGDFWARCAAHAGLARLMQDGTFVVGPMTGTELREAITGPATAAGLQVDTDLAATVLADLRTAGQDGAEGILPLLSQAMMLTWQRRDGNLLTVPGYHETGGVARSVEFGAEAVYEALPDAGQQIAREVFRALVLVGPDGQLARRSTPRAELAAGRRNAARHMLGTVLEAFASSRLLVLDGDTVQIAHDVLLRAWPRLRGWLDSEQANWVLYAQLQEDAAEWAGRGRDSSFLYRGSQLAAVEQAAARWTADPARYPALTGDESGFLDASRRHATRSARTRRVAVLTLALLLVLSVAGIGIAGEADRTANQQRNEAVSNQLAAQSEALAATNPAQAASLAAAAWKIDHTAEAQTALLDVLAQPERAVITAPGGNINSMAFSPDGKRFATVTDTGLAQVWDTARDTATHHQIGKTLVLKQLRFYLGGYSIFFSRTDMAILLRPGGAGPSQFYNINTGHAIGPPFRLEGNQLYSAMFSPDGKIALVGGSINAPNKWSIMDVATRHQIGRLFNDPQPLAFSPAGKLLAMLGEDLNSVQILDTATQRTVGASIPAGTSQYPPAVAFSPDSDVIAVNERNSVSFWDIAHQHTTGTPIAVSASGLAFSPNGKILATIGAPGTAGFAKEVDLWDVASGQQLGGALTIESTLPGGMVFSPDSTMLATADGATVSFWDVAISRQIGATLNGAAGPIAVSPNGQVLGATTRQGPGTWYSGLWNIATHREIGGALKYGGPRNMATAVAISPDGKILAVGGNENVGTQLWDIATRRKIGTVRVSSDSEIGALAFSPDGKYLAIAGAGYTWLWDMHKHRITGRPMINRGGVTSVGFSPDGKIIAFANGFQVRLFSVATQRQLGALRPASGYLGDMAFSPDGDLIAAASDTGVILWQVANQKQIGVPLDTGTGTIDALAFSPDGALIAAGGQNGSTSLWDVATHEKIGSPLTVNHNSISGIAFSPDGTVLAAADQKETRLWGVALTNAAPAQVCAIAGGSMTRNEWSSYVKSEPYQLTCP
jgi:WD40 repeat protein